MSRGRYEYAQARGERSPHEFRQHVQVALEERGRTKRRVAGTKTNDFVLGEGEDSTFPVLA